MGEGDIGRLRFLLGTGARWEDMPVTTGSYVTVSGWYYEWEKNGVWQTISRRVQIRGHHRTR